MGVVMSGKEAFQIARKTFRRGQNLTKQSAR